MTLYTPASSQNTGNFLRNMTAADFFSQMATVVTANVNPVGFEFQFQLLIKFSPFIDIMNEC